MKIAILGAGGVGGYYGALLARAGHEVTFIARGTHLQALRQKGLQVKSLFGNFLVAPAKALEHPADVGPVDLVIVATKTYHLEGAAHALLPLLGPETVILPLQNGVDAAERIGAVAGMEHLIGGATWLSAAMEAPGVIGQYSQFRRIVLGEFDRRTTPRVKRVHAALTKTDVTVEISDDILKTLWTKFLFIASVSAMGCLTRVTFGEFRAVPETRAVMKACMAETAAVARARGVALDADVIENTLAFIDKSDSGLKPSMQRDLEAGRITELESLIGIVARLGRESGVPAPAMEWAYAMLKPAFLKAREGRS
jgi:2-dehydropantoate 2-reductase